MMDRMQLLGDARAAVHRARTAAPAAAEHAKVLESTLELMTSQQMEAFRVDEEPAEVRERYGDSGFGRGCLMARRLVEVGVPFVEVTLGGWDLHQNCFTTLRDEAAGARPGDERAGRGPGRARAAGGHGRAVDGRVRPHAADQRARPAATTGPAAGAWCWAAAACRAARSSAPPTRTARQVTTEPYSQRRPDGDRVPGAGHLAGDGVHREQRPADEDRQRREGDSGAGGVGRVSPRSAEGSCGSILHWCQIVCVRHDLDPSSGMLSQRRRTCPRRRPPRTCHPVNLGGWFTVC